MVKVILIEPNKNHQAIFATILRKESFEVKVLKDFSLIKSYLINCPLNNLPDLLILGYDISFVNSIDIINFIHKHFYFSNIKILKLCPHITDEQGLKYIDAGANGFLNLKDFTPDNFISKINDIFAQTSKKGKILKNAVLCEPEGKQESPPHKYDYMLLDFPDENKVNEYVNILKKLDNMKKTGLSLCVITNEKVYKILKNKNFFPKNLVYLLKPLSRVKIFDAMDKLATNIESQMKSNQKKCKII